MSSSALRPRPDQVAELTRGLELPLPAIDDVHLEFIAEVLQKAFQDVRADEPHTIDSGNEAEVTALMEARLNELIEHNLVWSQLVLFVARGKESVSFDGSHLEKRPDLSIVLSDRVRRFPLVVEAKIVDVSTAKGISLYCKNGLRRFLVGEYAWGSREALMIGYVRDGSTIEAALGQFLTEAEAGGTTSYLVQEFPSGRGSGSIDLASSRHGRSFVYINREAPRNEPGPISVWHLWLS